MKSDWHDDDDKPVKAQRQREFTCPSCHAHNPYDDGFGAGDEVQCCYCGVSFKAVAAGDGFKLREV